MNIIKKICALLILCSVVFVFTSCSIFHKHNWQDFLAKEPTCTEGGLLKRICIDCGETHYSKINISAHNFLYGYCTNCGGSIESLSKLTKYSLPGSSDEKGVWSTYKIYETFSKFEDVGSYKAFMNSLDNGAFIRISIGMFGKLRLTFSYTTPDEKECEIPLTFKYDKVSPINPDSSKGTLWRADVIDNELLLTYTNGRQLSAGTFNTDTSSYIIGFGINHDKEIVVYYSDSTVAFGGSIAS